MNLAWRITYKDTLNWFNRQLSFKKAVSFENLIKPSC